MLLLLAPALAVVGLLLVLPLGWLAWQSIYQDGFTPEHYLRILQEDIYWNTFRLTFSISASVTVLAALLGFPVAYAAARLPPRWATVVLALVVIPFWTSVLVRAYAWLVLLQRRGVINQVLMDLGIVDEPLALVHNATGTIIGTVHVLLPFMVLPLYAVMRKIPGDLLNAAASLGARPGYVFARVFLPLSAPGLLAGAMLVFVLCLGFYITPELLGGGRTIMVSMLVQRNVELYHRWGAASAVGLTLLFVVFAIFWIVDRVLPLERVYGAR
ncbi:MAG: ABC transporter permease [Alphaproteobacteria bacterium]|nr:ABC transporter permease [Alphaproteobacteria bacterium]